MTIENVREYRFDPKEVIKGLNGYYGSDKCNSYITVRRNDVEGPAYLSTPIYLSSLIEWLRVDYDIFYRPGLILDQVEAARNAAKMCCLRAHIKDEISKRGLWCDKDADIPELVDTLFKAYDECSKARDRNRENAIKLSEVTQELRKELNTLKDTVSTYESKIRAVNEQLKNTERETRKKDTDYIAEVLRDILEALGISKSNTMRFDVFGLKTKALQRASVIKSEHERYREQLGKATADYKALSEENQKLKASQKSDVNKLIRDCCTKHGVIAPSRYFSDEACIEYLFSLIEQKDRSFAILQNLYRDIFKKQPDGLSAEDIANNILDKVLETEALLHLESVDNYKLSLKDYILHDIKERGYRYNGLETKSIEEIVDWIIAMATCPNKILEEAKKEAKKEAKQECYWYLWNALKKLSPECDALRIDRYEDLVDRIFYEMSLVTDNCKQCQRKHSTEKLGYILRTNKAEEELKKLRSANEANNDVIKKLKELLNEINKEEDGEWFKP